MSYQACAEVWRVDGLPVSAKMVLLCIAQHANEEGMAWPSINRITRMTGMGRSTVCRYLKQLEKEGYVSCRHGGGAQNETNMYTLNGCLNETRPVPERVPQMSKGSPAAARKVVPQRDPNSKRIIKNSNPGGSSASRKEMMSFAQKLGMPASDGSALYDYFEANGWKIGGTSLESWKSAMRYHKSRGWLASQSGSAARFQTEQKAQRELKSSDVGI